MTNTIEVTALTPGFGAEVRGLEPGAPLDDEARRRLRGLFDERGVLVFRDFPIDRLFQAYLALLVHGTDDLTDEAIQAAVATQGRFYISNRLGGAAAPFGRLMYHSDMMWSESPFTVLSLWGEDIEPPVAPTAFASTAHAWRTLPDALRARVTGRSAVQVTGPEGFDDRRKGDQDGDLVQPERDRVLSVTTPIAKTHPRTGETLLYVSQGMTKEIAGLPIGESESLLEDLFAHMYGADNTWQHQWRPGDLVMWDNLAIQHARPQVTVEGPVRTLRKIGWPLPAGAQDAKVLTYQKLD